jgi:hypothetical protein
MNAARRTRIALAVAACALIAAPAAQASLADKELGFSRPGVNNHARTGSAPITLSGVGNPAGSFSPPAVRVAANGFDWQDAGVGFGTAAGIALLAAGTVVGARRLREPRVSSV